uniref:Uncharacterized protein n=1 Tax=Sus scrofa TaxID=9823 RepID=A0A8D1A9M0_PIG
MNMSLSSPMSAPQFESKSSHISARNGNCFLVRHTPHPRRVCHIKGLNNIPICNVNDDENAFKTWCGVGQLNPSEKGETPFAKCSYPPSTVALESPGRGVSPAPNKVQVPPRPHSEPYRKIGECFKTSSENPLVIKKVKKQLFTPTYLVLTSIISSPFLHIPFWKSTFHSIFTFFFVRAAPEAYGSSQAKEARDGTCILMDTSWVHYPLSHNGNSLFSQYFLQL